MQHRFALNSLFVIIGVSVLAGCGGGGGGGTTNQSPTPTPTATATPPAQPATVTTRIAIAWGQRSRAVGNLNSALSAVVRLQGAKVDGSDLTFTVNRDARPESYVAVVSAPEPVRVGQWTLTITFFSGTNGTGTPVSIAQATADVTSEGTLPDVAVASIITQVDVAPGQQIAVGQKSDLQWTARAADGAVVPVSIGSGLLTVGEGGNRLRITGGQVEGVLPGAASVAVTIDGVTSVAAPVKVTSSATVAIAPNPAVVSINGSIDLAAQVSQTTNQAVTWSVLDGGTITPEGRYTAPATAGVYTVRAVSQYDPEKSATVSITVQDGSINVGGDFPESGGIGVEID